MNDRTFSQFFPHAFVPETVEPFLHRGDWAIHDVLPNLFNRIGAFELKVATFNISEDSLRPLFFMCDRGEITRLSLLLDMTVRRHKLDMLLFAANITPHIRLDANHAKIILAKNESYAFGIVGSQNMNQPKRNEAGFYMTAGKCFDFFDNKYNQLFDEAMTYELDC